MKWTTPLIITFPFTIQADIYKCTDANGTTVFSQTRCSTHSSTIEIEPTNPISPQSSSPGLRPGELEMLNDHYRRTARNSGKIMKGMSKNEVITACGYSTLIRPAIPRSSGH